jgi:hypothetical protein
MYYKAFPDHFVVVKTYNLASGLTKFIYIMHYETAKSSRLHDQPRTFLRVLKGELMIPRCGGVIHNIFV